MDSEKVSDMDIVLEWSRTGETLKQPPEDVGHMNSAYGQLFLRDFFQRLYDDRSMGEANRP